MKVFENIINTYSNEYVTTTTILSVLLMVSLLSIYEFIIYRKVSHRSFYSKSFNIVITLLPFFISTIILCLQSNIIITLGTIGALAIIRFRTSVKDPVDMMYLLWSVYIGIICGCQLFEVGVLTSIIVTIVLLFLEHVNFGKKPLVLILHSNSDIESYLKELFKNNKISNKIKSRNYTNNGYDFAIELSTKNIDKLKLDLSNNTSILKYSIIEYDADDIV